MEEKKRKAAIEAILFTMGDAVELNRIAEAIGEDPETTLETIRKMMNLIYSILTGHGLMAVIPQLGRLKARRRHRRRRQPQSRLLYHPELQ